MTKAFVKGFSFNLMPTTLLRRSVGIKRIGLLSLMPLEDYGFDAISNGASPINGLELALRLIKYKSPGRTTPASRCEQSVTERRAQTKLR